MVSSRNRRNCKKMPGIKGTGMPTSWCLTRDENIENVERIKLTPMEQRELGCAIGEYVFLEYPWAYVPREAVTTLAGQTGSDLEVHRERIHAYQSEKFLVGYASGELVSTNFVICLSETTREWVRNRNRRITKKILNVVSTMIKKTPNAWKSLKSDDELNETFVKNTRPFYEIEISLSASQLGQNRDLGERGTDQVRDGYIEILPGRRRYNNVPMKLISRCVQTNLEGREASVQCYFGYPRNKWTQYDEVIFVDPDKIDKSNTIQEDSIHDSDNVEETVEKVEKIGSEIGEGAPLIPTPLGVFLNTRCEETIDFARYNSVINMHSSDIDNLANRCTVDSQIEANYVYDELGCYIYLEDTRNKIISDVSWDPNRSGYFAVSYLNDDRCDTDRDSLVKETLSVKDSSLNLSGKALVWSLDDSLRPRILLEDIREIHSISYCPYRREIVIGGSGNGQILIWSLRDCLDEKSDKNQNHTDYGTSTRRTLPIVHSITSSDGYNSHISPICAIRWLPADRRIETSGKFTKLSENTSVQFMSASKDGMVAIWDLVWQPSLTSDKSLKSVVAAAMASNQELKPLDGIFEPHFRIMIKSPKESIGLTVLDLCLARCNPEEDQPDAVNNIWLGAAQGRIILGTWQGQEFDSEGVSCETSEILQESSVHNGPVIQISRCPDIQEMLLTISDHVFAIWKDDYLCAPLLWRRCTICEYTASCWSAKIPGTFLLGRIDGDVETWDISRKTTEPVLVQTISGNSITGLYGAHNSYGDTCFKVIGICDYNGALRVYEETEEGHYEKWERIEWFRNFVRREVERKREFRRWQDEYLKSNETALERRAGRVAADAKRRHEEARQKFIREQEESARLKAERKIRNMPKSKDTLRRAKNLEIAKNVLLQKKGFVPEKLKITRIPLVQQQEEKNYRLAKSQKEISNSNTRFVDTLSCEFPGQLAQLEIDDAVTMETLRKKSKDIDKEESTDFEKYSMIQDEAWKMLSENPRRPEFDWNVAMKEGRHRKKH